MCSFGRFVVRTELTIFGVKVRIKTLQISSKRRFQWP